MGQGEAWEGRQLVTKSLGSWRELITELDQYTSWSELNDEGLG